MRHFIHFLFFVLIVISTLGCFSGKHSLRGKVTFSDDRSPLQTGTLLFVSDDGNFMGTGKIQADGTYRASSAGRNDGLPPGNYKVRLNGAMIQIGGSDALPIMGSLVADKYRNTTTSGWEVRIPETKVFDIQVERADK